MKTHKFDIVSFLSGLVATGIGLMFLIPAEPGDILDAINDFGSWFLGAVFLAIGIAVIAPLLSRSEREETTD